MKTFLVSPFKTLIFKCFVLSIILPLSQALHGQTKKVTIDQDSIVLSELIQKIESAQDLSFVYTDEINVDQVIQVSRGNHDLEDLLKRVEDQLNLHFIRSGETILIRKSQSIESDRFQPETMPVTVQGNITDDQNLPLPGATIVEKGTTNGVISNLDGDYSISISSSAATLEYSFVGMKSLSIPVNGRLLIDVQMTTDVMDMEEVIVTGYSTERAKDLTGSVTRLDVGLTTSMAVEGIDNAIQGRVPGVQVSSDGSPGGGVSVRIRGYGTLGDNDPLYVIDGVPTKSGINQFNMKNIESIQVLKDAAATAIYGSRAANGVIVITTKQGKFNQESLSFDGYVGVQMPVNLPEMLNTQQYADLLWEAQKNAGLIPTNEVFGSGPEPVIPDFIDSDSTIRSSVPGTDWFNELFNPAMTQYYNLGYSYGQENTRTAFSVSYLGQEGTMKYTSFDRINARLNTEFKKGIFSLGENLSISYSDNRSVPTNSALGSRIIHSYRMNPVVPVKDIYGNWASSVKGVQGAENPMALNYFDSNDKRRRSRIFGDVYIEARPLEGLSIKSKFGIDYSRYNIKNYDPRFAMGDASRLVNKFEQKHNESFQWIWSNIVQYKKSIDSHYFSILGGTEAIKYTFDEFGAARSYYFTDDIDYVYLSTGEGTQTNYGFGTQWALFSLFGRLDYNYEDRYLVAASFRRDGSSRFSENNKYAFFPSVSVGWRISSENFMDGLNFMDDLKVRASWGQSGNQEIGDFPYYSSFTTSSNDANYDITGSNNTVETGFIPSRLGNPEIKWETTTQTNIGIDLTLFNRFSANFDYFYKYTEGILLQRPTLALEGQAEPPFVNAGKMENSGLEALFRYSIKSKSNFNYDIGLNLTVMNNKVLELADDVDYLPGIVSNSSTRNLTISRSQVGYPIAQFYGYVVDGIFQNQTEVSQHADQPGKDVGRLRFKDLNNDRIIDDKDRQFIGNPHPRVMYGLNFNGYYKKFDLGLFIQGVQGVDLFNFTRYYTDFYYDLGNRHSRILNAWSPSRTDATIPRISSVDANNELRPSTYFIENGSYLRIRDLQIGYSFSKNDWRIQSLRIYIQVQNLHTFTSYQGMDPEVSLVNYTSDERNLDIGVDRGIYPNSRVFLLGLNIQL